MKTYEVLVNKKSHHVRVTKKDESSFSADVDGKNFEAKMVISSNGRKVSLEVDGKTVQAEVVSASRSVWHIRIGGKTFEVQRLIVTPKMEVARFESAAIPFKKPTTSSVQVKDAVLAPIAGKIIALKVTVGQRVSKGDCICILEAMKMANEVAAPKGGVVKEIRVSEGAVVNKGDLLAVIV